MWFIVNVYKQDSLHYFTNLLAFLAQTEKGFT